RAVARCLAVPDRLAANDSCAAEYCHDRLDVMAPASAYRCRVAVAPGHAVHAGWHLTGRGVATVAGRRVAETAVCGLDPLVCAARAGAHGAQRDIGAPPGVAESYAGAGRRRDPWPVCLRRTAAGVRPGRDTAGQGALSRLPDPGLVPAQQHPDAGVPVAGQTGR